MTFQGEQKETKKILILIVDDMPANLQVLGTILTQENYEIAVATTGLKALELAENITPDLILLDVVMPGMDGFEVCRVLKTSDNTSEIPIIFLTVKEGAEHIVRAFELGAADYLTKPFNTQELLARVRTHVQLKLAKDRQNLLIARLQQALEQVKYLRGLIPICANCKSIRNDQGYWDCLEEYISSHTDAIFTHGICPDCVKELYPEYREDRFQIISQHHDNKPKCSLYPARVVMPSGGRVPEEGK
ncbi:MAG: response regulator [Deltaproteobacteria bacterium]|nr:response regulator [Deltaproteobacteria bacterium]